jgi:hypothetical protein
MGTLDDPAIAMSTVYAAMNPNGIIILDLLNRGSAAVLWRACTRIAFASKRTATLQVLQCGSRAKARVGRLVSRPT